MSQPQDRDSALESQDCLSTYMSHIACAIEDFFGDSIFIEPGFEWRDDYETFTTITLPGYGGRYQAVFRMRYLSDGPDIIGMVNDNGRELSVSEYVDDVELRLLPRDTTEGALSISQYVMATLSAVQDYARDQNSDGI